MLADPTKAAATDPVPAGNLLKWVISPADLQGALPHSLPAAMERLAMSIRNASSISLAIRGLLVLSLLAISGCAGRDWKNAVAEDTPAAYYRFMREHSDSNYISAAHERLEFHKLKRSPTLAGFDAFRAKYPDSELTDALHPALEKPAFEAAQAQGTAEAYRSFAKKFATGREAARATGNAVYVEASGFGGDADALARFAKQHPESDFAAEAERTAIAHAARKAGHFDRVGLVMKIDSRTPEAARVRDALVDRIEELMERVGIQVVPVPAKAANASAQRGLPTARLEVRHRERSVEADAHSGGLSRASILGETEVVLRDKQGGEVIAKRRFELRVEDRAHVPGTSVLFSAVSPKYWSEFFVPTARWQNNQTVRPAIELSGPVVDVDAAGDRVVVLYENGNFDVLGLADPTKPVRFASYQRGEDFKRWSGVRMLGSRIAIFGEEGLELVRFTESGPVADMTWDRGKIGRVRSIAQLGDQLAIVGAKGLQIVDPGTGTVRRVMRRVLQSVASAGEVLIFVDGESVYISSLALLAENRVIAQMKLGRTFGPKNVRVHDQTAIVTGPGGALVIDVRNPQAPKALAKLSTREVGEIFDASRVRGRTFLVGARGALLLTRSLNAVEETIDVGERNRIVVMGRHLVTANRKGLQVVDASPWADGAVPAAAKTSGADALLNGSGFE